MKNKLLATLIMGVVMVSSVFAASDFIIEDNGGSDLLILNSGGLLNITTGKIAEQGTLLEEIYCSLTGCTMTGEATIPTLTVTSSLNATGATLTFDANSIEESDISFDTVCGSGNTLYISGGNLACEAAATDTKWAIDNTTILDVGDVLQVNESWINDTIDARAVTSETDPVWTAASGNYFTKTNTIAKFVNRTDWTSIDDYPTACNSGEAVQAVGDTLTCVTIADEVTDSWVNETGDTMTGDLVMNSADINLTGSSVINGPGSNKVDLQSDGDVVITLGP